MLFLGDYASKQTSSKQEEQVNILALFLVELANSQLSIDLIMIYNDTEAGSLMPEHSSHVFHLPKDDCFKRTFPKVIFNNPNTFQERAINSLQSYLKQVMLQQTELITEVSSSLCSPTEESFMFGNSNKQLEKNIAA